VFFQHLINYFGVRWHVTDKEYKSELLLTCSLKDNGDAVCDATQA